jgi:ABC-2 type transport system permease protein
VAALIQTWSLFVKELKVLLRDRQALLLLFVMPAVFIFFLSLALKNVFLEKTGAVLPVVLESSDHGELASRVEGNLRRRAELRFVDRPPGQESRALFLRGDARAVIQIPEAFSDDLKRFIDEEGGKPFGDHRIVWEADPVLDATYRWFIRASIALAVQEAILDAVSETEPDQAPVAAGARDFSVEAPRAPGSRVVPTPLQQTVPGWSLFAMFFIVVPLSNSFIRERQDGTLRRLMTYPVSRGAIVAGKLAPYLLINIVQFALMLMVGLYVVPLFGDLSLQLGAHPWHLPLITLAAALAATGYGALVASLARTIEQAGAFGATSIIVMAVIGGVMVPGFVMPRLMQDLACLSPLYWGLQAYLDVFLREAPLEVIAPRIVALVFFSLVCLVIAARRFRSV